MKKSLIIGGVIVAVLLVIAVNTPNTPQPVPQQEGVVAQNTQTPKYEYEILARVTDKVDENVSVLIKPGEKDPQGLATEVQKSCTKQCNISLYDDKKAYDLDVEYNNLMESDNTEVSDLQNWKEKNYVFVGDHLVGVVGYAFGPYDDYPFKDWYYKELKGE